MIENLVKRVINNGGRIKPLIAPFELSQGTGQTNPSLYIGKDGKVRCNLRSVQYVILHAENNQKYPSKWGPLAYINPENDIHLTTTNLYMELNEDLNCIRVNKVDTSLLDVTPLWEFIGLEDVRLVCWDDKWWMCGVRRDTTTNGEGRMEMSEISITDNKVSEIARYRIQPPIPSYCEKNWMPIFDKPFHFVKWTNLTEVVKVNLETLSSETVFLSNKILPVESDLRGGSSVIHYNNHYYAITHEVNLFKNELGQKDAFYYHRFVVWDEEFNLIRVSDKFNFMTCRIEFCCGMIIVKDKVLISFGVQDNVAYILEVPLLLWEELVWKN